MENKVEKIKRLEEELKTLNNELVKYGNMFNEDGHIDADEQAHLDSMLDVIKRAEDKLQQMKKEIPSKPNEDAQKKSQPIAVGTKINSSVGKGGKNKKEDVTLVQKLLNDHGASLNPDGISGRLTEKAIKEFQSKNFKWKPDGRVDPGGKTWGALSSKSSKTTPTTPEKKENPKDNQKSSQKDTQTNNTPKSPSEKPKSKLSKKIALMHKKIDEWMGEVNTIISKHS